MTSNQGEKIIVIAFVGGKCLGTPAVQTTKSHTFGADDVDGQHLLLFPLFSLFLSISFFAKHLFLYSKSSTRLPYLLFCLIVKEKSNAGTTQKNDSRELLKKGIPGKEKSKLSDD